MYLVTVILVTDSANTCHLHHYITVMLEYKILTTPVILIITIFPTVPTTKDNISVEIKAYLNHSRFTDPRAEYYASVNIDDVYYKIGTINQNSANAGWNYVNTRSFNKNYKIQGAFVVNEAYVCPSGSSGYETGADAVYVTPSY